MKKVNRFSPLKSVNENLTDNRLSTFSPSDVKKVVFEVVSKNGYIKGSYGYHNNNGTSYRGSPTVADIVKILDAGDFSSYQSVDLSAIDKFIDELSPSGDFEEFQKRLKDVWGKNHFVRDDIATLCSAVNYFIKNRQYEKRQADKREKEAQHQQAVASDSNRWAGEVGEEISFIVKEARVVTYIEPPYYNAMSYPLWKIVDKEGLVYSWGDTSREVQIEKGDRVKAKVKRLNEYRGIKETQIWKVKVEKHPEVKRGFFTEDYPEEEDLVEWLDNTFRISDDALARVCDWNYHYKEGSYDEEGYTEEFREVAILDPYQDISAQSSFDNINEVAEYYGIDFLKKFIPGVIAFAKENGCAVPELKNAVANRRGFFR